MGDGDVCGELGALRWSDVDLAGGVIHIQRWWDDKEGLIETKSANGRRKVSIAAVLRDYLDEQLLRAKRTDGLVFGRSAVSPIEPGQRHWPSPRGMGWKLVRDPEPGDRPKEVWVKAQDDALDRIGLHERGTRSRR